MALLILSDGTRALIDDEDFPYLSQFRWSPARRIDGRCYVQRAAIVVRVNGKRASRGKGLGQKAPIMLHREIMNAAKGQFVDHINHNTLDNRKENLRLATNRQNQYNSKRHRDSTSQYKGVCWEKSTEKWMARITTPGGRVTIGFFTEASTAAKAYDAAAAQIHGEFAYLNFPTDYHPVVTSSTLPPSSLFPNRKAEVIV